MYTYFKKCSMSGKIERFLLKNESSDIDLKKHLESCPYCQQLYKDLKQFYRQLFNKLEDPVAHNVFNLLCSLEGNRLIIAGIILKPHFLDEQPGKRHFTSEIVLNSYDENETNLDDLDCIPLDYDEVLIRAIQSVKTNETTLFLYSKDKRLYSNVVFDLPTLEKSFKSDRKGKIEIGHFDIGRLDNLDVMITTNI